MAIENAIIVRGKTRLEQLNEQFNTKAQAEFYIQQNMMVQASRSIEAKKSKGISLSRKEEKAAMEEAKKDAVQSFNLFEEEHAQFYRALAEVERKLGGQLKLKTLDRTYLPSYIFTDKDVVLALGQDGLVANTAKYVNNIPIIGVNPDPARYDGVLLPFSATDCDGAVHQVVLGRYAHKQVTMAEAKLTDGQRLLAFNDLFIGPSWHTSARYRIRAGGNEERHSSSGIIVSTGAGSTGWMSSLFNQLNSMERVFGDEQPMQQKKKMSKVVQQQTQNSEEAIDEIETQHDLRVRLPWDTDRIIYVVREPFQSKTSQVRLTAGFIERGQVLELESFMPNSGLIFSDGINNDFLHFNAGAIATVGIAPEVARLVLK